MSSPTTAPDSHHVDRYLDYYGYTGMVTMLESHARERARETTDPNLRRILSLFAAAADSLMEAAEEVDYAK